MKSAGPPSLRLTPWKYTTSSSRALTRSLCPEMSIGERVNLSRAFIATYRTAVTLMKRFCRENPVERIGYQKDGVLDIKKHRWFQVQISSWIVHLKGTTKVKINFQGFDWEGLDARTLEPPITPKVGTWYATSIQLTAIILGARCRGHLKLWQVPKRRSCARGRGLRLGQGILEHSRAQHILRLQRVSVLSRSSSHGNMQSDKPV